MVLNILILMTIVVMILQAPAGLAKHKSLVTRQTHIYLLHLLPSLRNLLCPRLICLYFSSLYFVFPFFVFPRFFVTQGSASSLRFDMC